MTTKTNETNIYYTLQALETKNLTELKYRQLKNRIKELINTNNKHIGTLIYKKSNVWFIHYSVVDLFAAKRVHDKTKPRAINYKNEITINLEYNYNVAFYQFLGTTIAKILKGSHTIFSVEPSPKISNTYHLHMGTTAPHHIIIKRIKEIESKTNITILNNPNTNVSKIRNLTQFVNYIAKQNQLITNI
ncbi:hypothetical protein [Flavobacterium gilvum]|uniref:Uncharacterized protein n=1 Tax=Flavobacterium gilvum TaxID=1492737 RepID=A0AAC9N5L0_9FLAO|nr:hypothetical protein [Flavobacterium gilvum]AOW09911.1 hypothetical protein EM308_10545 [Flavobacterium gilvum]KFC58308.1 hypothetical protein FEM08_29120 [Flavobacterium gilvum]